MERFKIAVVRGKTGADRETDCIRCMGCEVICSFAKEHEVNPEMSRIRVVPKELEWIEGASSKIVTHQVCQQCPGTAPCLKACPVEGAINRDSGRGTVLIDDTRCTRCQECVRACPFHAIWYHKEKHRILKCDLCGGEPECVRWCPVDVLRLVKIQEGTKHVE